MGTSRENQRAAGGGDVNEELYRVIEQAVASYRLSEQQDDDGNDLDLVEVLTPPEGETIERGLKERADLVDWICGAIIDSGLVVVKPEEGT